MSFFIELFVVLLNIIYILLKTTFFCIFPKSKKNIENEIILITGGGRGIGRRIALEFTKYCPRLIILWGRKEDFLLATTKAVKLKNVPCVYMCCDVGNREEVYSRAKEIKDTYGDVSILVNNAGVTFGEEVLNSGDQAMQTTFNTNTFAHVWTVKAFLPAMLEKNCGHLVFMNSMLGLMGLAGAADYSASKHAATGLADSLWYEIHAQGKDGVHVTNIHPYMVDTDMFAGCQTRYKWMFPPLDPDYVARKTVDATLRNRYRVLMPIIMYPVFWAKSILPFECIVLIRDLFWVDKAMQHFHGRKQPELPEPKEAR